MAEDAKVVVKKVRPYPFPAQLEKDAQKIPVQVRRLFPEGALLDLGKGLLRVGQEYGFNFSIPTLDTQFLIKIKVMRVSDQFVPDGKSKGTVVHMAEVRFLNASAEHLGVIQRFLQAIRQV